MQLKYVSLRLREKQNLGKKTNSSALPLVPLSQHGISGTGRALLARVVFTFITVFGTFGRKHNCNLYNSCKIHECGP